MAAEQQQQKPTLPEEFLKVIHGQVPHEDKKQQYQESLQKYVAAAAAACAWRSRMSTDYCLSRH